MENLQVGAYGWNYDSWVGSFYPEDIPEEWRLDFYSNAFRVVLVPEMDWLSWCEDELEDFLDAVEGDFSFFFEVIDEFTDSKQLQLNRIVAVFESCAKGVVIFLEQDDAADIAAEYSSLPVTLVSKSISFGSWQWEQQGYICSGEPCGVVLDLATDAKLQTNLLKSFMNSLPEHREGAALLVRNEALDMSQLYNLKTIGEFLGY